LKFSLKKKINKIKIEIKIKDMIFHILYFF
jgi:hypothetical protein